MADYKHKSMKSDGVVLTGRIEAANERDAYRKLVEKGLEPFFIKPATTTGLPFLGRLTSRLNAKARARYVRQMATLLAAGLPLLDCMESLSRNGHPELRARSLKIRQGLRAGERLSQAIAANMPDFPPYLSQLAELGEQTGGLADALSDAAQRMEQEEALRREIRSALTYPAFLAATGVAITIFMFLVVVPQFEAMIGDDYSKLPLISKMVLSASAVFRTHTLAIGIGAIVLLSGVLGFTRSRDARARFKALLDRTPVVGPFLRRAQLANWARTMGIAMRNGAPLLAAFDLAARSVTSPAFSQGLKEARRAVRAGEPLDEALSNGVALDPTFTDLLRTGRQAAALDRMLVFMSDILDDDARERAKRITALAEPVAILLISLVVGTLVVGIVLAMTSLYQFEI
ncbi:secretion system protein [Iodidimonas gelatinilytica]|uniref:Secretion system protein n=2 Tax=Iodidimonas gelatinilytica TaxID=1236966 RepID=A0A5A7MUU7_9PROT|nr:type II secretion system F family protein [Iodidimonas gelatinilytica]GEQ99782.1 secretion system protein [Iodidimonas gelatinilytica]